MLDNSVFSPLLIYAAPPLRRPKTKIGKNVCTMFSTYIIHGRVSIRDICVICDDIYKVEQKCQERKSGEK